MSNKNLRESIMAEVVSLLADRDQSIRNGFMHTRKETHGVVGMLDLKIATIIEVLKTLGITDEMLEETFAKLKRMVETSQQGGEKNGTNSDTTTGAGGDPAGEEGNATVVEGGAEYFRRDN